MRLVSVQEPLDVFNGQHESHFGLGGSVSNTMLGLYVLKDLQKGLRRQHAQHIGMAVLIKNFGRNPIGIAVPAI